MLISSMILIGCGVAAVGGLIAKSSGVKADEVTVDERPAVSADGHEDGDGEAAEVLETTPEAQTGLEKIYSSLKVIAAPYTQGLRRDQMEALAELDPNHEADLAKRNFYLASASFSLALAGSLFFAPLIVPSVLALGFLFVDTARKAVRDLVVERRMGTEMMLSVAVIGVIAGGFLVMGALGIWMTRLMQWLLSRTEHSSRQRLVDLFGEKPETVWILVDGVEVEVAFEALKIGDLVVVMAGQQIPADGEVVQGIATIDQRALTGEAQPIEVGPGDLVMASTLLTSGRLEVKIHCSGSETTAAQIGEILARTSSLDPELRSRVEAMQDSSVPWLMGLAALSLPAVGLGGALAIIWYSPGFRMLIFGPMTMLNFLHICSSRGILVKDGRSLDLLDKIDVVIFDKTGTLTLDEPRVCAVKALGAFEVDSILRWAAAMEAKQSHPIAKAILTAFEATGQAPSEVDSSEVTLGYGLSAFIEGQAMNLGSRAYMELLGVQLSDGVIDAIESAHALGHSSVLLAVDGQLVGLIQLEPQIRPEAIAVVERLKASGKRTYIVSGDHEEPTRQLAERLGIDDYRAATLPEEKADFVKALQAKGHHVCFVGDGINDSIALRCADVSISLSGATTIATDSAQIVLMDAQLSNLPGLFDLAAEFRRHTDVTLWSTIIPNTVGILGTLFFHWGFLAAVLFSGACWPPQLAWVSMPVLKKSEEAEAGAQAQSTPSLMTPPQ